MARVGNKGGDKGKEIQKDLEELKRQIRENEEKWTKKRREMDGRIERIGKKN